MLSGSTLAIRLRVLASGLALVAALPALANAQSDTGTTPAPKAEAVPAPVPHQVPAPYRWSGVYFGGTFAPAWSTTDVKTSAVAPPSGYFAQSSVDSIASQGAQSMSTNDFLYGGEAGYDFQVAQLVFGGAFDFAVMNMKDFVTSGATYPCCAPSTYAITQTIETNWLMTARARVGWVSSRRLLIYGTFGIAWTDLNYKAQFSDNFAAATESAEMDELVNGWVYGAGLEYRLGRTVSVAGEYLYANFDDVITTSTNLSTNGGNSPQNVFTHSADFRLNVVKGSIKFRF